MIQIPIAFHFNALHHFYFFDDVRMLIKIYNFTVAYYFEDNERKTRRRDAPPVFLAIIADS